MQPIQRTINELLNIHEELTKNPVSI